MLAILTVISVLAVFGTLAVVFGSDSRPVEPTPMIWLTSHHA